ncbi:hypothetical protein A5707_07150 [Mycobacterium kyorinense]|uniref:NAD-dependent epimerase/dehydratase domain-containing protein n=1 Tax=Mycobacterium kyorinense TaxID=487514 RepID=A0A1A2YW69_9MYCO|nr:hypothetical protein [Mycobacterium kyorinense]OBI41492.1 hypothetical protein A5707_07150 [Mycobacterium kyorinense]
MRILVTDVTGVLGRAVARQLVAAGHTVSGIARYPHACLDPEVDFVCGPLGGHVLQEMADESHVVVHLAPIEPAAPGNAGINGVVHVTHAAARAGARLIFVSQAAGPPGLYGQAETLVATGWAPSLIIRTAPAVGRQLDWAVCRTVATLLRAKSTKPPVRLVHLEDLVRFLTVAVATDTTGAVDLAPPDTIDAATARQLLHATGQRPHAYRLGTWAELAPQMETSALQDVWRFEVGWTAADAVADTARGLAGRRLGAGGALELSGRLPLPLEATPRFGPLGSPGLRCAAPDGLEGEFDDRIDPRFPVFGMGTLAAALPGPLTPMTLDVQLSGLRGATRLMGHAMALGGVAADEWEKRAIAVFGHRPYVGVSSGVIAASRLPGWDEQAVVEHAVGNTPVGDLLPLGRPPLGAKAAKAAVATRSLAMLRHLKTDTQFYCAAARAEHCDAAQLGSLSEFGLQARIRLLRDRVHQGWSLTALWVIDTGITAATLERTGACTPISGIGTLLDSGHVAAETAALAALLRRDPRAGALAAGGDVRGIRAVSPGVAAELDATVARIGHRGMGEAELAHCVFGDDPGALLVAATKTAASGDPAAPPETVFERIAANARMSRELAHDTTMRFTHELRMALRELGTRRVAAELVDAVDDVYYLTCDELLSWPSDARLRIKRRRAERERLQGVCLPDVIDHSWRPLESLGG